MNAILPGRVKDPSPPAQADTRLISTATRRKEVGGWDIDFADFAWTGTQGLHSGLGRQASQRLCMCLPDSAQYKMKDTFPAGWLGALE